MPSIGPAEVLVLLVLALLIFGPQKMPEIGRQVGRAMREFRKAQTAVRTELRDALDITGGAVTGADSAPPSYGTAAPTAPPETATATTPTGDASAARLRRRPPRHRRALRPPRRPSPAPRATTTTTAIPPRVAGSGRRRRPPRRRPSPRRRTARGPTPTTTRRSADGPAPPQNPADPCSSSPDGAAPRSPTAP